MCSAAIFAIHIVGHKLGSGIPNLMINAYNCRLVLGGLMLCNDIDLEIDLKVIQSVDF